MNETKNIANEDADYSGGAPGRDIGDDGLPRSVAGTMEQNAVIRDEAAKRLIAERDDREANDTPGDILRAFVKAAHETHDGATFAEPIRRYNAFMTRHDLELLHRQIPEAPPLDPDMRARTDGTAASAATMPDPGGVRPPEGTLAVGQRMHVEGTSSAASGVVTPEGGISGPNDGATGHADRGANADGNPEPGTLVRDADPAVRKVPVREVVQGEGSPGVPAPTRDTDLGDDPDLV